MGILGLVTKLLLRKFSVVQVAEESPPAKLPITASSCLCRTVRDGAAEGNSSPRAGQFVI